MTEPDAWDVLEGQVGSLTNKGSLSGKPALYYLLYDDVPPSTCWDCPFRVATGQEDDDEYYYCDLINKDIWAENPHCTTGDWQVRAREEYLR